MARSITIAVDDVIVPGNAKVSLLHEFGHIIDASYLAGEATYPNAISNQQAPGQKDQDSLKQCLEKMHGNAEGHKQLVQVQEDFADLISALDLKSPNISCDLLGSEVKQDRAVLTEYSKGSHSPGLFRVLHASFIKNGRLTPECEKFVKDFTKWKFQDCSKATSR